MNRIRRTTLSLALTFALLLGMLPTVALATNIEQTQGISSESTTEEPVIPSEEPITPSEEPVIPPEKPVTPCVPMAIPPAGSMIPFGLVQGGSFEDAAEIKYEVLTIEDTSGTVKVVKNDYSDASYEIPKTVEYDGVTYTVVCIDEDAFQDCTALVSIQLPDSVTDIGERAFDDCAALTTIQLSDSLVSIGDNAFQGCDTLATIQLPASVTEIGDGAFDNCSALSTVVFAGTEPPTLGELVFIDTASPLSILVPKGSKEAYDDKFDNMLPAETTVYDGIPVTIVVPVPATITYSGDPYVYTGTPTLKETLTSASLTNIATVCIYEGANYSASTAPPTNAGNYTLTISVADSERVYSGSSQSVSFAIDPKGLTDDMLAITGTYSYNGSPQSPGYTVKDGTTPLVKDTDYTETNLPSEIDVGDYTLTIAGIGNYSGTADATFTIAPAPTAPSSDATLSGLTLSSGTLTPAFRSTTTSYAASVDNGVSSVTIAATASHSGGKITGDIGANPLSVGVNTFTITVTAQDGTTKAYTIAMTRAESDDGGGTSSGGAGGGTSTDNNIITIPDTDRGWEKASATINDAKDGAEFILEIEDTTTVPADFLEEIAGKDVDLTVHMGHGLSWTFNGKDIPKNETLAGLDLGASIGTGYIPVEARNLEGSISEIQLRLSHDGAFDLTLTLEAALGKKNAGYIANLFYYDDRGGELEFMYGEKVAANGKVSFPFGHASDYLIVMAETSLKPVVWKHPFLDIKETDWFYSDVEYVVKNGLFSGTSDREFSPNTSMTRAMLVTVLWRAAGAPEGDYGAHMLDVGRDSWYADAMGWAEKNGIISGYGQGLYGPEDTVTREQLVSILYRYAINQKIDVSVGEDTNILSYGDARTISEYAIPAMQWACGEGIMFGRPSGLLDPQGDTTRAEVATVLHGFLELD